MKRCSRGIVLLLVVGIASVVMAAPTVIVIKPTNSEVINGTYTLKANVTPSENTTIESVKFYYKNNNGWELIGDGSLSDGYYTYNWNTTNVINGNYQLNVTAIDNQTNVTSNTSIYFEIANNPPAKINPTPHPGQNYINWTWDDPDDLDHVNVSFDSSNTTVPKGVEYYNTSAILAPNTTYTFRFYSCDSVGNCNLTITKNTTLPNTIQDGPVNLGHGVVVNFTGVTSGNTSMTIYDTNQWSDHSSLFSAVGKYYNITTTASFSYAIVEIPYSYDGSNENLVRLYHYDGTWKNVTYDINTSQKKVYGNVTSFSIFVAGIPPVPRITNTAPSSPVDTIGSQSVNFTVEFNQTVNVTWYINNTLVKTDTLVTSSYYLNTTPAIGTWNITVKGENSNGSVSYSWIWKVHPKTYAQGNRIWDGSKPEEYSLTYTWNPMSFYAFYYDLDENIGNESLQIKLDSYTDRYVQEDTLIYTTTPENVSFKYDGWGKYDVIGFMAEKYFAGYTSETTFTDKQISTIASRQLHKVLTDDDTKRTICVGGTLTLKEGYVLKAKDIDITGGKTVLFSLLKDGGEVDSAVVSAGDTYVYTKKVGSVSDLPIIAVHIETVFVGREANAAFIKGIFQLSESYTSVEQGNRYGIMEITSVNNGITMKNKNSLSLSPNTINDVMGDIKIIVADNSSVLRFAPMVQRSGMYEVRGTISPHNENNFEWTPMNFEGFYYDIDEDVGSEKLTITRNERSISKNNLVYTSKAQPVSFQYSGFGWYNVIGFMAEKYFAGYTSATNEITDKEISTIASKQLHKVLIDDDNSKAVYVGGTLTLKEGYVLKIKDVDITGGKTVLISLLKDGNEVDTTAIEAGDTYVYTKKVGSVSDLPIIAVHIETVFVGREANAAFVKGIFQLSESYTSVEQGDKYGIMEVSKVSDTEIEMKNPDSFSLSRASTLDIMGEIKFRVADSDEIRFYPFIMVNGTVPENQLVIQVPENLMVRDTITITVTSGSGAPVEGAEVSFDDNVIGTTNSSGKINYLLTQSGEHNITVTKLGYEKAVKTINVAEYVDTRLSIEVPSIIDQGYQVSIKVQAGGKPIEGANVTLDGLPIGKTDNNGVLNYTFNVSGSHNLGASKQGYISVVREINIRMPFSDYKALDINIAPRVVFLKQKFVVKANITNAGTKGDKLPVELIINNTVVDKQDIALAPNEVKQINFTGSMKTWLEEATPGNYSVEILGQSKVIEVKKKPLNLFLIGGIATVIGAIMTYIITAKNKISMDLIRQGLNAETISKNIGEMSWKIKHSLSRFFDRFKK